MTRMLDRRSFLLAAPVAAFACRRGTSNSARPVDIHGRPEADLFEVVETIKVAPVSSERATDITLDRDGNVYVLESATKTLRKFTSSGETAVTFSSEAKPALTKPVRMWLTKNGDVLVVEVAPYRVSRFGADGGMADSFLYVTHGVAGTGVAELPNAHVLLSAFDPKDGAVPLVYEFDPAGTLVRKFLNRDPLVSERRVTHFANVLFSPTKDNDGVLAAQPWVPTVYRIAVDRTDVALNQRPSYFIDPPTYPAGILTNEQRTSLDVTWLQCLRTLQLPSGHYLQTFQCGGPQAYLLELYDESGRHVVGPVRTVYRPIGVTRDGDVMVIAPRPTSPVLTVLRSRIRREYTTAAGRA